MSLREIFNKVEKHLLKQNERSYDKGLARGCRYRNDQGFTCAVGCLMTDDMYEASFEGENVRDKYVKEALTPIIGVNKAKKAVKIELLSRLQKIHDASSVVDWAIELRELKLDFNIS
tara:strand:+ start:2838 stop:3188 length:351 start_codon:yes stop_codon:yes gene_type:complete